MPETAAGRGYLTRRDRLPLFPRRLDRFGNREGGGVTYGTGQDTSAAEPADAGGVTFSHSAGLARRLRGLGCSIAFTSYQSGFLYLLGTTAQGGLHLHQAGMGKPMGLFQQDADRLTLACDARILRFENVLAPHERINDTHDACYVPRRIHHTGLLDAHDIGVDADGRPIFVATRFNCLATVSDRHSFAPLWRPPFIDALVDEDRCHLNGLAMRDGAPAFVTALSRSNTIDGWRDRRRDGGVVIDVARDAVVCEGLSMPHSPRWHDGRLWVLNAGTGELGVVEGLAAPGSDAAATGRFVPRAFCPGFLRGLSFHGGHAFVGLSKPRYRRFEGLALDDRLRAADSEPWCGVQVIELSTGTCVDWFRIDGAVAELYDVQVIHGRTLPLALSPGTPEVDNLITWDKAGAKPGYEAAYAPAHDPQRPWLGMGTPVLLGEEAGEEAQGASPTDRPLSAAPARPETH